MMSEEQHVQTADEILNYPFPTENRLQCPAEYKRLRQECPVARVHMPYGGDAYLLTRYADVAKAFQDPRCGMIQRSDGDVPRIEAGDVVGASSSNESLFSVSDKRHNKIRRLVTQLFTVQHANTLRARVVEVTNELIDAMERSGPPADLFEDYAIQTPMTVLCELLGIPRKDEKLWREWGRTAISKTVSVEQRQAQWQKVALYLKDIIEQERQNPRNTIISVLVKAHDEGGDEVLTEGEMYSFALGLIVAGFETVSTTFTNSAFILLQRPDLLEQLKERVDDPERMASAVEEILRITPVGNGRPRITRDAVAFGDKTIPSGEVIFLSTLSANYDEERFPDPEKVDFDRTGGPVMSFGRGIHACLGQQIARMELQTLWSTLLKRLPTIRLAVPPEEVPWRPDETLTYGPAHLPVTW
ncbi:cytochrome P450 RapN/nocardicin N-oxygenase [Thermosporothrix hazakensis]|jgi:cytochrome P450|uniref:Cytochrome P450 RapN/nocardicin N-oxygenase n=2 Tax=Thermosporothrix TaxID=768650 RepID=A0A326UAZ6_THEHA|nr:cytochrome P450 [Thermosporothrix hazakensis]PZW34381.1 cytochrome P450 RapN/nocardicin N-oxygenase [Thermosporothrix hazakensis]BBH85504.1 cytochrome P450 [Thermosporothrix sp. COM3]GCE46069.1 cytochrome P450 [Thermosporothrix hazakensis]